MQLVITAADFRRLSPETQKELLEVFAGRRVDADGSAPGQGKVKSYVQKPVDLTTQVAAGLVKNLPEIHLRRLELFARNGGRVSMKELLMLTGERDWHVISQFQGVVTRRLRRIIGDKEKRAILIGWDYETTKWNKDGKTIVDGVYYMSSKSAKALLKQF